MATTAKSTTIRDAILAAGVALSAVVGTYNITRNAVDEVVPERPTEEITDAPIRTRLATKWTRADPQGPMTCRESDGSCYCTDGAQAGVWVDKSDVGECDALYVDGGRVFVGARDEEEGR